jgi:hypothetical protein
VKTQATDLSVGDLAILSDDFRRSLWAANKSPKTVKMYMEAVRGWMRTSVHRDAPLSRCHPPRTRRELHPCPHEAVDTLGA